MSSPGFQDSFPLELNYRLSFPYRFQCPKIDYGLWLSAMGGAELLVGEGYPVRDADFDH